MSGVEFKGNVDSQTNEIIGGWIVDPANPARMFDVDLYLDGTRRGRVKAGFPRDDVKDQGLGRGCNGFYFTMPPAEREGKINVEVREAESQHLVGKPLVFSRTVSPKFAGLSRTEAASDGEEAAARRRRRRHHLQRQRHHAHRGVSAAERRPVRL